MMPKSVGDGDGGDEGDDDDVVDVAVVVDVDDVEVLLSARHGPWPLP